MNQVRVIRSEELSEPYEPRFIVVSTETGEVLDDAQGYGYRSVKNAYRAYGYKTRNKSKDAEKQHKEQKIQQWMKDHQNFIAMMDDISLEIAKGAWGPDGKFNAALVRELLAGQDLHPDFTAGDLLKVWKKRGSMK